MQTIPTGTWVLVADGTHARLFHNIGKQDVLQLKQADLMTPDNIDEPDQVSSGDRSAESTVIEVDETVFARQLAHRLNAAALKHAFEHLFLIADPKTLGEMRSQLHVETTKRISGELAKTLTNSSIDDIEKILKANA